MGKKKNRDRADASTSAPETARAAGGNWAALKARINAGTSKVAKAKAAERRAMEDVARAREDASGSGVFRRGDGEVEGKKPAPTGKNTAVTKLLALDCEMVGVGADGKRSILARVSIVNEDGNVIMDKFVAPTERVTDYRTAV